MNQRVQDRYFAACGIGSVILMLAGVVVGSIGHNRNLTITSSSAQVARAIASPAGAAMWVGAYIELLSFGLFTAFAVWACARLGGGLLGQIARVCAGSYVTLSVTALGLMDAIAYRSGKGMGVQLATTLVTVNEALYVGTWFLAVFFLVTAGALAVTSGRRLVGRSALVIAAIQLVTTAVSVDNLGQLTFMLWLAWIVGASIALARGPRPQLATRAVTQAA